jgi:isoleucyl-tRNA synthetase
MDIWILSFTNSLISFVRKEMSEYRLYTVVSPLTKYFDKLTNTYIRLNRTRFKGDTSENEGRLLDEDRVKALSTLGHVLVQISRLMAPFTPFFSEYLWENLRTAVGREEESVHYVMIPDVEEQFIDPTVERRVERMRSVIDIVRALRDKKAISLKVWVFVNVWMLI